MRIERLVANGTKCERKRVDRMECVYMVIDMKVVWHIYESRTPCTEACICVAVACIRRVCVCMSVFVCVCVYALVCLSIRIKHCFLFDIFLFLSIFPLSFLSRCFQFRSMQWKGNHRNIA